MTNVNFDELGRIPMSPFLAATLSRAASYADAQGHLRVTVEHLLLALTEDPEATVVLKTSNIDIGRLSADVSGQLGRIEERSNGVGPYEVAIAPELKRILEAAAAAATQSRRREINGAIVLAAIVGEGRSPSAHLLRAQGLTFEEAIRALQRAQAAPPPPSSPAPHAQPPPARPGSTDDILAGARERVQTRTAPPQPQTQPPPQQQPRRAPAPEITLPMPAQAPAPPAAPSPAPLRTEAKAEEPSYRPQWEPAQPYAEPSYSQERAPESLPAPPVMQPPPAPVPVPSLPPQMREELAASRTQPPAASPVQAQPPQPQPPPPPPPAQAAPAPTYAPREQRTGPPSAHDVPPSAPPQGPPLGYGHPQPGPYPQPQPQTPYSQPQPQPPMQPPQAAQQPQPQPSPPRPPQHAAPSPPPPPEQPQRWAPPPAPPAQQGPPRAPPRMPPPIPASPGLPYPGNAAGLPPPVGSYPFPPPGQRTAPPAAPPPWAAPGDSLGSARPSAQGAAEAAATYGRPPPPGGGQGAVQEPRRRSGPIVQVGQLAENIPRRSKVGIAFVAEARVARAEVRAIADGMQGSGSIHRHEVMVSKAMTVRLRAPDGGFTIETASPDTQWIENVLGVMADDYASWRWTVTPKERGKRRLQLIVSARTVGADGLTAETALPDQVIEVNVSINYAMTAARWGGWVLAACVGGVLARFGEDAYGLARAFVDRLGG